MKFDAFDAGINLGGLRSKDEIKLLICYLLSSIKEPLSKDDIVYVLQKNGLANYFEINDAISDLIDNNNISLKLEESQSYVITKSGKIIATQLDTALPISIREKALSAALNLLAKIKRERENIVNIEKHNDGYQVECNISGNSENMNLMTLGLFVPDIYQANLVKKNFQENPSIIYSCMLALLTKNDDMIKDTLNNFLNK